jgi:hypothetical protein
MAQEAKNIELTAWGQRMHTHTKSALWVSAHGALLKGDYSPASQIHAINIALAADRGVGQSF